MKKVFAFVAATVLFAGMASAQLGINVGYAPQTYTESSDGLLPNSMNGFFAGVNYNINLTGDLGVSLGVQYRLNTAEETGTVLGYTVGTAKYTQSLVDVPILFNYGLKLTDALKLSVFVGPTVSFALSGNTNISGSPLGILDGDNDWYDANSNLNKLDISGTVGVNIQYNAFRLFGGYNYGLLDLGKDGSNTTYDVKASNWFVGIGYSL